MVLIKYIVKMEIYMKKEFIKGDKKIEIKTK